MEEHSPKKEILEKPVVEVLMEGDVYEITCFSDELLESIVKKIAIAYGEPDFIHKEIINTLKNGGDWRFEGTFNLKLKGNKLIFDNRNGRGVKENRLKMKQIMETI